MKVIGVDCIMEHAIAIITARGGSKRIPKKNIKNFLGKPIIEYSIDAALKAEIFDEVMVSTDSEEIAEIAAKAGAKIPFFRSKETSDDFATTSDVLLEVLKEYQNLNRLFTFGCCIYPTAPFITGKKLKESMHLLEDNSADVVMPVIAFSYPPQRGMVIKDGILTLREPQYKNSRSQDLEKIYHDCGQFYCFNVDKFKINKHLMDGNVYPYIVSEMEVQDIDTIGDWELAEMKYKKIETE